MDREETITKIKRFIKQQKLTQGDFSRMIKCPEATVNRWLMGHNKISPAWAQVSMNKIEEALRTAPLKKKR